MANLFTPVIKYKQDFSSSDLKSVQLERTENGRKIRSQVFKFNGDGVEILLFCKKIFIDAMSTQEINNDEWQQKFGRTLHGDPKDNWNEVIAEGDDNGVPFDNNDEGFDLALAFYVMRYVADPNGRDTMVAALNTRAFRFGLGKEKISPVEKQ